MNIEKSTSLLSAAARAKIDQAMRLLAPARQDNATIKDVFQSARKVMDGAEPHIKAIEFDRPSKDVSGHGTALREQASQTDQRVETGKPDQSSLEMSAAQMEILIDGALADLGKSNYRASEELKTAKDDLDFAQGNSISTTGNSLRLASKVLTGDLDPYLTEVEADEPGRDVGRFADDIARLWQKAGRHLSDGPIYADSTERSLEKVKRSLESARSAL